MEVTPNIGTPDLFNPAPDTAIPDLPHSRAAAHSAGTAQTPQTPMRPLRFGGLTMHPDTGAIEWHGRSIKLPRDEHRVLATLMQHAGQILDFSRLADACGASTDTIEKRVRALKVSLRDEGVMCQPCKVNGIGYTLWRMPARR
jgi:DNA-binding response OmpR family regulator